MAVAGLAAVGAAAEGPAAGGVAAARCTGAGAALPPGALSCFRCNGVGPFVSAATGRDPDGGPASGAPSRGLRRAAGAGEAGVAGVAAPLPVPLPPPVARLCTGADAAGDDWPGAVDEGRGREASLDEPDGADGPDEPDGADAADEADGADAADGDVEPEPVVPAPPDGEVPPVPAWLGPSPAGVAPWASGVDVGGPSLLERTGCGAPAAPEPAAALPRTGVPSPPVRPEPDAGAGAVER